ncbi:MAG: peptidase C39 family protein [Nocardioidaceae bacterium]|nr:peptidase C39 family protein [Nocardioidaceae bacterium]MCL2612090.1 peptidase C39 family protein [Nocardioidaceae bacterium]
MRRFPGYVAAAALVLATTTACATAPHEDTLVLTAGTPRQIDLHDWDSSAALRHGTLSGTRVSNGRLVFSASTGTRSLGGRTYDVAGWTSPWRKPGFDFTQLIASWSAHTPADSWLDVQVRGRTESMHTTSWDTLARWAGGDKHISRTSLGPQGDDGTSVDVDTWKTAGLRSYQLRVHLMRRHGSSTRPSVDLVAAMTSRIPATAGATSKPGPGDGKVLPVPRYSQMVHRGEFPQWGGGGEAWCSPTSTSMVLGYYKKLPHPSSYSWVPKKVTDPWVDFAARSTYDHRYDGTGNWPFNTAYAAPRAGKAFVTRLRSLREAGRFIAAGIPVVVSVAFGPGQLSGAPISASNGHLIVIVGFTKKGDVVVNDPASSTTAGVRRTYDRAQFERVWLDASGGMAYIIHDAAHPLPQGNATNW